VRQEAIGGGFKHVGRAGGSNCEQL
jgi:hypothetical protein